MIPQLDGHNADENRNMISYGAQNVKKDSQLPGVGISVQQQASNKIRHALSTQHYYYGRYLYKPE